MYQGISCGLKLEKRLDGVLESRIESLKWSPVGEIRDQQDFRQNVAPGQCTTQVLVSELPGKLG